MKGFFAIACLGLMAVLLVIGCGQKREEPKIETLPEETTTLEDTLSTMIDSTMIPDTTVIKEAVDEGGN